MTKIIPRLVAVEPDLPKNICAGWNQHSELGVDEAGAGQEIVRVGGPPEIGARVQPHGNHGVDYGAGQYSSLWAQPDRDRYSWIVGVERNDLSLVIPGEKCRKLCGIALVFLRGGNAIAAPR
jgi:hypothetical protein